MEMRIDSSFAAVYRTHGGPMKCEAPPGGWLLNPQALCTFGVGTGLRNMRIVAFGPTTFGVLSAMKLTILLGVPHKGNLADAVLCHFLTESDPEYFLRIATGRLPETKLCVLSRDGELLAAQMPHSRAVHS